MDVVERAINKGKHISNREDLNIQTWDDFINCSVSKDVIVWGVGSILPMLWYRYPDFSSKITVLDNDKCKHGIEADKFVFCENETKIGSPVFGKEKLKDFDPDNTVILITSINGYKDIIMQLENLGFINNYVMLIMEANHRKSFCNFTEDYDECYLSRVLNLPVKKGKIFVQGFGSYSDHAKYITESLLSVRNDLDIVWLLDDLTIELPSGIRKIYKYNKSAYIHEIETSQIWLINTMLPENIIKRPGQIYIHTKHWASVTLKKFYLGASTITDNASDVKDWKYNSSIMDYIITGSKFDQDSCKSGFEFSGKYIEVGSPRSDAMFNKEIIREKIISFYGISNNSKILVYAPTYRYKTNKTEHNAESRNIDIDFNLLNKKLNTKFGGKWIIMLRLHPSVKKYSKDIIKEDYVIDASEYNDGEELAAACDIMISDYSSIMFEPAFVRKPVFLFATDIEDYIDKEYDLLLDYRSLPFPIAETNEQLAENIMNFDNDKYIREVDAFMKKYGVHEDGHASERAAKFISNLIDGKEVI